MENVSSGGSGSGEMVSVDNEEYEVEYEETYEEEEVPADEEQHQDQEGQTTDHAEIQQPHQHALTPTPSIGTTLPGIPQLSGTEAAAVAGGAEAATQSPASETELSDQLHQCQLQAEEAGTVRLLPVSSSNHSFLVDQEVLSEEGGATSSNTTLLGGSVGADYDFQQLEVQAAKVCTTNETNETTDGCSEVLNRTPGDCDRTKHD